MGRFVRACATALLLGSLGCRTSRAQPARAETPAVIVHPSTESRAVLAQAVSTALNGVGVTLAADALTSQSTLSVERALRRDANGLPLDGRDRGSPEKFRLVKSGHECMLVHEGSGRRIVLAATECVESN